MSIGTRLYLRVLTRTPINRFTCTVLLTCILTKPWTLRATLICAESRHVARLTPLAVWPALHDDHYLVHFLLQYSVIVTALEREVIDQGDDDE